MLRPVLMCALFEVAIATVMYLFGIKIVLLLGMAFCVLGTFVFIYYRDTVGLKTVIVFIFAAIYCLYLVLGVNTKILKEQELIGKTESVICRVIEEPTILSFGSLLQVEVENSNNGVPKGMRFDFVVNEYSPIYNAIEGDIISADISFQELDGKYRKNRYADGMFVGASFNKGEIVGHRNSIYTYCVKLRKSIKLIIDDNFNGDSAALLKGILLGDVSTMRDELYNAFKVTGVCHITAVSGMHIGALCLMAVMALRLFLNRRTAAAVAIIPLLIMVLVCGATPSAIRAGIMCFIMLLGDIMLRSRDSLTSLGFSIALMLFIQPFYVCSLSFQLSCSATAGVILSSPYSFALKKRIENRFPRYIGIILGSAVLVVVQSVGAVIATMPFQIVSFGYVSIIAPISSMMINAAVVYIMAVAFIGMVLYSAPFISVVSSLVFWLADVLLNYVCIIITLLSRLSFAYILLDESVAVMWCGLSLALIGIWILFDKVGNGRLITILVSALFLIMLWSEKLLVNSK